MSTDWRILWSWCDAGPRKGKHTVEMGDLGASGIVVLGQVDGLDPIELESGLDVLEFLVEVALVADFKGSANKSAVYGGLDGRVVKG